MHDTRRFNIFLIFHPASIVLFILYITTIVSFTAVPRLPITTWWRLGAGGAFTAVWTGAKLANLHKLSGEPLPRLRQTARYLQWIAVPFFLPSLPLSARLNVVLFLAFRKFLAKFFYIIE